LGLRIVPLETHSKVNLFSCLKFLLGAGRLLRMEDRNWYREEVAQPARRVKDKRLRRAFGILDAARWMCFVMVKGLLPTPVIQG
jgi:hypothetical protein